MSIGCVAAFATSGWFAAQALPGAPWGDLLNIAGFSQVASPAAPQVEPPPFEIVNGESVVVLSTDVQRAARIEIAPLEGAEEIATVDAFASVIDLQPLFDLRARLSMARDTLDGARATAETSRVQYERTKALLAQNALAQKDLQLAEATMQADQAKLDFEIASRDGLAESASLQFGPLIADALKTASSDLLQKLLTGKNTLFVVSLPGDQISSAPEHIRIDVPGTTSSAASLLSSSPRADPAVPGQPYFYIAEGSVPVGAHARARVAVSDRAVSGVLVPDDAIIWYGGLRWVYVRTAPERFTRRLVANAQASADRGILSTGSLKPGDMVVVLGGQLLLSQELKPRDITQQCPDPPACDG